jgi:hypothetical protein
MHMEARPQDYGALIAQAALWEQVQLPGFARGSYEKFEKLHREKPDHRYDLLAEWAGERLKELRLCQEPPADPLDADSLGAGGGGALRSQGIQGSAQACQ